MSVINDKNIFGEVDSIDFAIYLNKKAQMLKKNINVTKIQKWLYICYGLNLALEKKQLLYERPRAWEYGPAFPRVHSLQKKHNNSLDNLKTEASLSDLTNYDEIITTTLNYFGNWTASELVAWTHEDGKAWNKAMLCNGINTPLDNLDIQNDFLKIIVVE